MATKKKDELEMVENVEASSALMAGGNADAFDFSEGIEGSEMTLRQIPTLKLTQNMTPEVTSRDFPDVYAGMYINDVTKEVVSDNDGEVKFRLISMWKQRIKFPPRDSGATAIECSCPTANTNFVGDVGTAYGPCKTCVFNNFDAKERCQTQYTLVVAVNDDPNNLYKVILSRTSYKAGDTFRNALQTQARRYAKENIPLFMFEGVLKAKEVKNMKISPPASYYVSTLECVPAKEVPMMDAALKQEFIETFKEVRELRNKQIEVANKIAQQNLAEKNEESENSETFNTMNSNIADELGLNDADAADAADVKAPL